RSLHWTDKDTVLKTFSTTMKANGNTTVKLELEIGDPFRLGAILQELAEIKKAQCTLAAPARQKAKKPAAPLMLSYSGGKS
ncbi:MAG: hypothetical protein KF895_15370, partial [Parvibaculum sp.]|nr:hypothetical protein [Parvibaculum sp.]